MTKKSEISTKSNKEQYNREAYNTRNVQGLPPGRTKWSPELEQIQVEHNRILQEGFMRRDASDVLNDALIAGAEWITDVTCPSTSAAIMLHIAKEMVVKYQVADKDLNIVAHKAHESLATTEVMESINAEVEKAFQARTASGYTGEGKINIEKAARDMLISNKQADTPSQQELEAAKRLAKDMALRKIQDEIVSKKVAEHLNTNMNTLDLKEKTLHAKGTTQDFAFFGAAGSGKSSISKEYLSDEETGPQPGKIDRRDCVTLATDNYRAFTMPGTDAHESKDTKDVYTRSQDFAYMVKEYVGKELDRLSKSGQRPNLICDCIRLEWPMGPLLQENAAKLVSKVAAYRGSPGFVGIAERADTRAKDENAAPADKGRFVHTTDLLKGHVDASKFFLGNLPPNTQTEILDTDVDRDAKEKPRRIAMVDSKNKVVEITDLRVMSEFMNKQSINMAAEHPVELILKGKGERVETTYVKGTGAEKVQKFETPSEMRTNPVNKANAILSLVTPDYSVILKDKNGTPYAEFKYFGIPEERIKKDGEPEIVMGKNVFLNVLNARVFKEEACPNNPSSPGAQVLRQLTKMTALNTVKLSNGTIPEAKAPQVTRESALAAQDMLGEVDNYDRVYADFDKRAREAAQAKAESSAQTINYEPDGNVNAGNTKARDDKNAELILSQRVLSGSVASPKIITGNYSAIMSCMNEVLSNSVTIAPDGNNPKTSPIIFIAEPMWLDKVDKSYDNEPWGQSIDGFPPAIQKFAKENVKPTPKDGVKLTWGQVRELRAQMLEHLAKAPGFTVVKGEVQSVKQTDFDIKGENITERSAGVKGDYALHQLKITVKDAEGKNQVIETPQFKGKAVVLDLSQRPRPAGPALEGDPTVLYHQSREQNARTNDVPIIISGSGAQAAWVMDKMDNKRTYTVIYRTTIDFRIANAILGDQKYGPDKALVNIADDPKLKAALDAMNDGTVKTVTYTRDDKEKVEVKITLYNTTDKSKQLIPAGDLLKLEPQEAKGHLMRLGVKEPDVEKVILMAREQMSQREGQGLDMSQLAIKLNTNPLQVDVGFAVNNTGFVALNDLNPRNKFWGEAATVTTGEALTRDIKLVTTASLLPNSGIPRTLAMKAMLQEMKGEGPTYDVRGLAFTEKGFDKMCKDCGFSEGFKKSLAGEIKKMETPNLAGEPVEWIVNKYGEWLDKHPNELPKVDVPDNQTPPTKEERLQTAKQSTEQILQANVEHNAQAETGMRM